MLSVNRWEFKFVKFWDFMTTHLINRARNINRLHPSAVGNASKRNVSSTIKFIMWALFGWVQIIAQNSNAICKMIRPTSVRCWRHVLIFRAVLHSCDIVTDVVKSAKSRHSQNTIVFPRHWPKASPWEWFEFSSLLMENARIWTRFVASHNALAHANLEQSLIRVMCTFRKTTMSFIVGNISKYPAVQIESCKVFQLTFSCLLCHFSYSATLHQLKECDCCSVSEVRELPVELVCEDNYKLIKHFNIPSSCSCSKCGGDEIKLLKLTATSWKLLKFFGDLNFSIYMQNI